MMISKQSDFIVKFAETEAELQAAQSLRYDVFVSELGADGNGVDHVNQRECDVYDPVAEHLLLIDRNRMVNAGVVGVYRLLTRDSAKTLGGFYSETEFDLAPLLNSRRPILELGRSCLHKDYRGSAGIWTMWSGLSAYIERHGIEILFGVASFHGTEPDSLAQPLSYLHHFHLAPEPLRAKAIGASAHRMDLLSKDQIDRKSAVLAIPPLLKGYLRLGGFVGQGAWIDREFNTVDVCMVLDTAQMDLKRKSIYRPGLLA